MQNYTLVIIGSGSAGLPAGMYASRYNIKNIVIGAQPGGALATSHCVENYPGVISDSGKSIMDRFAEHAKASGSELLNDRVTNIQEQDNGGFVVTTERSGDIACDYILMATWNDYRHLGVPWEEQLIGSGVSYCATCDGQFFKGRDIILVGGGDTAFTEALYLSEIAKTVKILVRGETAKAEHKWQDKVAKTSNIEVLFDTEVETINGKFAVESVTTKKGETIPCQGVFVAVWSVPRTELVEQFDLEKDPTGCLVVDKRQRTSHPRIYAAGDVTTNSNKFQQTIMSAAEGCLAANSIHEDILDKED